MMVVTIGRPIVQYTTRPVPPTPLKMLTQIKNQMKADQPTVSPIRVIP